MPDSQLKNEKNGKGLANVSIVLSIGSLIFGGPFTAIPGVILGHIAQKRLGESPSAGIARAGIIIGYVSIALYLAFLGYFLIIYHSSIY